MNLDDLTIGQAKQLVSMISGVTACDLPANVCGGVSGGHPFVGRYVIARGYSFGVHAGEVVSVDGENVVLKDSRRLWNWKAADGIALSGVAQNGIDKAKCKIDTLNPLIYLAGLCELIPCTRKAQESINA